MRKITVVCAALIAAAMYANASQTRVWSVSEREEFEKGSIKRLSVSSDGKVTLAPSLKELYDSSSPYLWAVARDSKGNLYAGGGGAGGAKAKLYMVPSGAAGKVLAELDGMDIYAVAVDKQDGVYAATSPDGKVYRVLPGGRAEVFYSPGAKYIWAMAFAPSGDLFVATGDKGEVHRVTPAGKGGVFFKTDETHARSLAIDARGNLIVGTEPGGLILRVSPAAEGFVLYQAAKREVTAVAVAADGTVYAAAAGARTAAAPPVVMPVPVAPVPAPAPAAPAQGTTRTAVAVPSTFVPGAASLTGGSEVYRIETDGFPRKIWSHPQEIVYTLAVDRAGRAIAGTGNKGNIYRLESELLSTLLLNTAPTQITSLASGPDGELYAASGNIGKLFAIGPGLEKDGTIESEAHDSTLHSQWGRIESRSVLNGGRITISTRSGNLDSPSKNWSPWSASVDAREGGRSGSPAARFIQWRAMMEQAPDGRSPELDSVSVAYLPKNVAPVVEEIEITPPNYKFPPQSLSLTPSQSITLPPLPRRTRPATPQVSLSIGSSSATLQYAKGFIGARWAARDENGDDLTAKVEIRGVAETEWKLLKEKITDKHYTWDSTAFPDGEYRVRVTASDSPDNPAGMALTAQLESEKFTIDNTPPEILSLAAGLNSGALDVRWTARDARSVIERAEYSLDGGEWTVVEPTTKLMDSRELSFNVRIGKVQPGEHTIAVRVADEFDNQAVSKTVVKP
ncbi:MAG: hypothetical protein LLG20_21270 [Acidobacteriales bacterium]|nr:hypothetical protein [Terriglobales bacterium]